MRAYFLLFCLLFATACDQTSPLAPTGPLSERLIVNRGATAVVEAAGVRLQFVDVTGDSRCPADAVCILGGDAVVHVRVADLAGGSADYQLHTGDGARAAVVHRDVRIELTELQPYPFSSRPIAPDEYRATFTLTRP